MTQEHSVDVGACVDNNPLGTACHTCWRESQYAMYVATANYRTIIICEECVRQVVNALDKYKEWDKEANKGGKRV